LLPTGVLAQLKKVHYARVLRSISDMDEPDLSVLKYLLRPGQLVADIGANIGVYTKYLSQCVGPNGKVISVEPVPLTFDILRSNVRKLGLKNVDLRNVAVSDIEGLVRMCVPKYRGGGDNFYEACIELRKEESSGRLFEVHATTIDRLLSGADEVHFIKCDVEGYELNCIRGAMRTLERFKPAWLIEVSGDMCAEDSNAHQTLCIMRDGGYEPYWFDGARLRSWTVDSSSVNYFFLTDAHLAILQEQTSTLITST